MLQAQYTDIVVKLLKWKKIYLEYSINRSVYVPSDTRETGDRKMQLSSVDPPIAAAQFSFFLFLFLSVRLHIFCVAF